MAVPLGSTRGRGSIVFLDALPFMAATEGVDVDRPESPMLRNRSNGRRWAHRFPWWRTATRKRDPVHRVLVIRDLAAERAANHASVCPVGVAGVM